MPIETGEREMAIREIFKDVLASHALATTCYEIYAHDRDLEFPDLIKQFRDVQNRGVGAYRDIFCACEWRHDREQAMRAVGSTLSAAGVEVADALCVSVVDAVMRSMPGAASCREPRHE